MEFDDLIVEIKLFLEDKGLYVSMAADERIIDLIQLLKEDPYNTDLFED